MLATLTEREAFMAVLFNGPILPSDAIVIFSGDGKIRLDAALGALHQRIAHNVVVSGGVDDPPHSLHADEAGRYLINNGLAPERVIYHRTAMNTHEQADALAVSIIANGWERVTLAVSAYHAPRAFLTVLASLQRAGSEQDVHIVVLPASQVSFWGKPAGRDQTRLDLLADEFDKIERYREYGHVASYSDGLAYLRFWEGHDADRD